MDRSPAERTAAGRTFQRTVFVALALVVLTTGFGCASAVIRVGDEGGTISHPALRLCPGVVYRLTIEPNTPDRQPVTIEARAAAGIIRFMSRDLTGNVLDNIVRLRLQVLEVPKNDRTEECPFRVGDEFLTDNRVLVPARMDDGDAVYEVDLDDFKRQ